MQLSIPNRDKPPIMILIENKLDASEQVEQGESYREEARELVVSGRVSAAGTVLLCPDEYARSNRIFVDKFDSFIAYEAIAEFFENRAQYTPGELASRLAHRGALIRQAILKSRRGYIAVPHAVVDSFNKSYVSFCRERFHNLILGQNMLKEGRPSDSKTMIFSTENLPSGGSLPRMRLVHQLKEGNANVNFYGWGDHFFNIVNQAVGDLVGTGYRLVPSRNGRKDGKSGLMLTISTPPVDNLKDFQSQQDAVIEGLQAVERLKSWIAANTDVLERWSLSIQNSTPSRAGVLSTSCP